MRCNILLECYYEYMERRENSLLFLFTGIVVVGLIGSFIWVKTQDNTTTALGNGKISIKAALKKATKTGEETIEITIELAPDYQKDYEIVPYAPDADQNQANIDAFMAKYVTKPFIYLENTIGVEVNFNKVFYTPEQLRPIADILNDLAALDTQLAHGL